MKRLLILSLGLGLLTACQHTDPPIPEPLPDPARLVLGVNLGPTYDTLKAENLLAVSLAPRLKPDASGSTYVGVLGGRVVGAQWAATSNRAALAEQKRPLLDAGDCTGATGLLTDVPGVPAVTTGLVDYPGALAGVLLLKVLDAQGAETDLWWSSGQGTFQGTLQCGPETVMADITLQKGWNGLQITETGANTSTWRSVSLIGATLVPDDTQLNVSTLGVKPTSSARPSPSDWRAAR